MYKNNNSWVDRFYLTSTVQVGQAKQLPTHHQLQYDYPIVSTAIGIYCARKQNDFNDERDMLVYYMYHLNLIRYAYIILNRLMRYIY